MRELLAALALVAVTAAPASAAITLAQAKSEAVAWVTARQTVILDRIIACIAEGTPRLCHTAYAASTLPNTAPTDNVLATVTLDDPGRQVTGACSTCFLDVGKFSQAGISIPATAPLNAKINIARSKAGWGAQLVVRIQYDGTLYERGFGRGIFAGFAWREVIAGP